MTHHLLHPEVALRETIVAEMEGNSDCIFAVAYIDRAAVAALAGALNRRLDYVRFSLRVVFRASDLQTDPVALEELLWLGKGRKGMLSLRWSMSKEFHAKAFGFRRTQVAAPTVIVGSANLTRKALGANSGELGVRLGPSSIADAAWLALEGFWNEGKSVTTAWLADYRKRHARKETRAAEKRDRRMGHAVSRSKARSPEAKTGRSTAVRRPSRASVDPGYEARRPSRSRYPDGW